MSRLSDALKNGTPLVVTEEDIAGNWGGDKSGANFRCTLCGHRFSLGDQWRWVYTNDSRRGWGNPKVCERCDGTREEIISKMISMREEAENRMWWFCNR